MKRCSPVSSSLPLFLWPEQLEIGEIEKRRRDIRARLVTMRARSQRRFELEDDLRKLTLEQLSLQIRLDGKSR